MTRNTAAMMQSDDMNDGVFNAPQNLKRPANTFCYKIKAPATYTTHSKRKPATFSQTRHLSLPHFLLVIRQCDELVNCCKLLKEVIACFFHH